MSLFMPLMDSLMTVPNQPNIMNAIIASPMKNTGCPQLPSAPTFSVLWWMKLTAPYAVTASATEPIMGQGLECGT